LAADADLGDLGSFLNPIGSPDHERPIAAAGYDHGARPGGAAHAAAVDDVGEISQSFRDSQFLRGRHVTEVARDRIDRRDGLPQLGGGVGERVRSCGTSLRPADGVQAMLQRVDLDLERRDLLVDPAGCLTCGRQGGHPTWRAAATPRRAIRIYAP
jgi:hypothetical protein